MGRHFSIMKNFNYESNGWWNEIKKKKNLIKIIPWYYKWYMKVCGLDFITKFEPSN